MIIIIWKQDTRKNLWDDSTADLQLCLYHPHTVSTVVWGHDSNFDLNITVSNPSITWTMRDFGRSTARTNSWSVGSTISKENWEDISLQTFYNLHIEEGMKYYFLLLHWHFSFHQEECFSPSIQTLPLHNLEYNTYWCLEIPLLTNQLQQVLPAPSPHFHWKHIFMSELHRYCTYDSSSTMSLKIYLNGENQIIGIDCHVIFIH